MMRLARPTLKSHHKSDMIAIEISRHDGCFAKFSLVKNIVPIPFARNTLKSNVKMTNFKKDPAQALKRWKNFFPLSGQ